MIRNLSVAAALSLTLLTTSAMGVVETGKPAPAFQLTGHDGKSYKLADLKGKFVVLEWYNDDCPYVEKHYDANNMQSLQKKYTAKGVTWLTVVSSAPGKQGYVDANGAKALIAERKSAPTSILLDPEGQVGKSYGAKTTPHMFVINPEGKVVYQGAIDDKPSTRASSLKDATPYFANALDATLAGKPVKVASTKPYGCSVKYKD